MNALLVLKYGTRRQTFTSVGKIAIAIAMFVQERIADGCHSKT